jgi:hypothetical protein
MEQKLTAICQLSSSPSPEEIDERVQQIAV